MNNASLITPTFRMLAVGLSFACSLAYADTEGYLSTSSAAGTSEVGPSAIYAGQTQAGITAREAARRKAEEKAAEILLQEGRSAYAEGKYSEALEKYRQAWNRVPHAPATKKLQEFIRLSISDASIAVAIEYSKVGRYDDAEQLLLDVLKRDPSNARARKELSMLRDPVRNNPALTPEHVKDVDEVNRLLSLAWGYYELGKYNEADAEFNNVLKIDPYNTAARRGQEAVQQRRINYYSTVHDTYRAKALAEVTSMWEAAMPNYVELDESSASAGGVVIERSEGQLKIIELLDSIRIPRVSFDKTPITDVVEFLRAEIRRSGGSLNVNYVKRRDEPTAVVAPVASSSSDEDEDEEEDGESTSSAPAPVAVQPAVESLVTTDMENVTMRALLDELRNDDYIYVVRDNGVYIYQKGDPNAVELQTVTFNSVPKSYLTGGGDGEDDDGGDDEDDAFGSRQTKGKRFDPAAALRLSCGADFSARGARASYNANLQQLIVTNTPENLELIADLITESRGKATKMVKITTKFVEVSQTNDDELSFDWVVNPFSVSNNGTTFLGGGTSSDSIPNRTYNDFVTSGGSAYSNYHTNSGSWPVSNNGAYSSMSDPVTNGMVTSGLRSGSGAISSSSMDSLIAAGSPTTSANAAPAPGILSLTGIYDSGSFQMIMRGLSQKRGVDVMSAPSLVMIPGEENVPPEAPQDTRLDAPITLEGARIEVVRRFVYPTLYDAPQIPENSGGGGYRSSTSTMPVAAPSNPSDWGVEEVGLVMVVKMDSEPVDNVIKFSGFIVRVVDFEGFINYGSPIVSGVSNQTQIESIVLTENRIDQPIFSRKMVSTTLSLYDGYTVAIGGMIEDRVQKVEDKVPVFGDLPLIGRFFRSNAESHSRKNLTVFVTADIIDPTGKPVRSRNESQSAGSAAAPGLFPDDGLTMP